MATMTSGAGIGRYAARREGGLLWTEYLYLVAIAVAAFVAVDPLEWDRITDPEIKHLALAISIPVLALTIMGSRLHASRRRAQQDGHGPFSVLWPLLLLACIVMAGGVYARMFAGIQNSFMVYGLYMLVTYCAAIMVWRSNDPGALVRAHFGILLVGAAIMSVYLIANYRGRQVYHEQIFLVIPVALLFLFRTSALLRWGGFLYFMAMSWLSAKYTSYLIGALTVVYAVLFVIVPRAAPLPGLKRTMLVYWFWLLGGLAAIVLIFMALNGMFEVPTGNVEYRSHTYGLAWDRFMESPIWGTLFAVEAVEKFTLYSINDNNELATHSDVLDLLANGGLIGVMLWVWGLVRIARAARQNLLRPQLLDDSWAPYAHTLALMSAAGIITYTFNPILLQPGMSYLLWTNLGLLAGLALRAAPGAKGSSR